MEKQIIFIYGARGSGCHSICNYMAEHNSKYLAFTHSQFQADYIIDDLMPFLKNALPRELARYQNNILATQQYNLLFRSDLPISELGAFCKPEYLENTSFTDMQELVKSIERLRTFLQESHKDKISYHDGQIYLKLLIESLKALDTNEHSKIFIQSTLAPEMIEDCVKNKKRFDASWQSIDDIKLKFVYTHVSLAKLFARNTPSIFLLKNYLDLICKQPTAVTRTLLPEPITGEQIHAASHNIPNAEIHSYNSARGTTLTHDDIADKFLNEFALTNTAEQIPMTCRYRADLVINNNNSLQDSSNQLTKLTQE